MPSPAERLQPAPASAQAAPVQPAPYQAPRVTDLGAWQAVTLVYSGPFNGSHGLNINGLNGNSGNNY